MPRATNGPASRRRRKRVLEKTKGFRGARSKLFRYAKDALYKAQYWAYRDRKQRKRNFRSLWIQRINAASRALGLNYNRLIEGLDFLGVEVDRKILADLAVSDEPAFAEIVAQAKDGLESKKAAAAKSA